MREVELEEMLGEVEKWICILERELAEAEDEAVGAGDGDGADGTSMTSS